MKKWSDLKMSCLKECGEHELPAPDHLHIGDTLEEAFTILKTELLGDDERREVNTPVDTITPTVKYDTTMKHI